AALVADRLEHVHVGMRAAEDALTLADELRRERERGGALPGSGRPVEEVCVRRSVGEGRGEQPLRLALLRKAVEAVHGSVARGSRAAASHRRGRYAAGTTGRARGTPRRPSSGTPPPPARSGRPP